MTTGVDVLTQSVPIVDQKTGRPTKEFMIKWQQLASTLGVIPATAAQASALLDKIGSTQGSVLYRGLSSWTTLGPGTAGQVLVSGGVGANPSWGAGLSAIADGDVLANTNGAPAVPVATSVSALLDHVLSSTQGAIIYRGASLWSALAPGTSGNVLTSGGAAANPSWASAGGGGGGLFGQILSATPTAAGTGLSNWLNQGTATHADVATGLTLTNPSTAAVVTGLTKTAPTAPYTVKVLLSKTHVYNSGFPGAGVGWYDGSSKLHVINVQGDGSGHSDNRFDVEQWNSPTSFNASSATSGSQSPMPVWLQLKDDGTNVSFSWSNDGVNFLAIYSVAKSSGFLGSTGYSNIIFFTVSNGEPMITTLLSYSD